VTKRVTDPGDRVRCLICSQWPKLDQKGRIRSHTYPWYHSQHGTPCPGSGNQIVPLPGQTTLEIPYETIPPPRCDEPRGD